MMNGFFGCLAGRRAECLVRKDAQIRVVDRGRMALKSVIPAGIMLATGAARPDRQQSFSHSDSVAGAFARNHTKQGRVIAGVNVTGSNPMTTIPGAHRTSGPEARYVF
ncbi:hypothetical protein [Sphingobium wenxiniae]|uniref:Uncharacterized protein n=1 Tax=Sphingobium wenxiniae (strain DSM 21828 / CGMCC 1.7748 / JZ-1) TaxID=595605 RepID=A0A562K7T9_SPHWJ|nr:hypothetical protein [Sphingobium wenxiniae]TWH91477.1 hypothetical protein IQ35_03163 [Sphingobium wenxiniae]